MANPVHAIDRELRKWSEVREMLASHDLDEQTLLDTLEGETDLHECLADLDESLLEDETQLAGLDATITKLEARAQRHRSTIEFKRRVILKTMERAGLKTVKGTVGTLSLGRTPRKLVVFETAIIPEQWWIKQEPKLDKAAIKKALTAGDEVVGATLDNGSVSLTIRRS